MKKSEKVGKKKILDNDLETISGGCGKKPKPAYDPHGDENYLTHMVCMKCRFTALWIGNYEDKAKYKCPECGKWEFVGWVAFKKPH